MTPQIERSPEEKALLEAAENSYTASIADEDVEAQLRDAISDYAFSRRPPREYRFPQIGWLKVTYQTYTARHRIDDRSSFAAYTDLTYDGVKTHSASVCPDCKKLFDKPQKHWCERSK
jgi:hypothetical protein